MACFRQILLPGRDTPLSTGKFCGGSAGIVHGAGVSQRRRNQTAIR